MLDGQIAKLAKIRMEAMAKKLATEEEQEEDDEDENEDDDDDDEGNDDENHIHGSHTEGSQSLEGDSVFDDKSTISEGSTVPTKSK